MVDYLKDDVNSLFIDFDDTLVDYPSAQNQALQNLLDHHGLDSSKYRDVFQTYHNINNQLWPLLERGEKTIPQIREERFHLLKQSIPFDETAIELDRQYLDYFVSSTTISKSNLQCLQDLKAKGYNLIITTNGIRDVQRKRVKHVRIDSIIDEVVTSEDVGKAKPAPLMFETMMERYSINHSQVFIIGDSLSSDIKGANNANIRSCWINYGIPYYPTEDFPKPDIISRYFTTICEFIIYLKDN